MRALIIIMSIGAMLCTGVSRVRAGDELGAEAKKQFAQGVSLYNDGKFDQASISFARAYELRPHFKILWNIGQVENELGHYAAALDAYSRYLSEGKDNLPADRFVTATAEIERLENLVGMIVVETEEDGVVILIDKEERGQTPLTTPIFVDLGKHEVVLEKGRNKLLERVIRVAGGQRVVIGLDGEDSKEAAATTKIITQVPQEPSVKEAAVEEADTKEQPADEEIVKAEPAAIKEDGPQRVWTWVAFAAGGASAIGAGITGGLALSEASSLEDACDSDKVCLNDEQDTVDKGTTLGTVTDILIGVAAAGVVTGIILYFVESRPTSDDNAIAITPTAIPGGGIVSVRGNF